MDRINETLFNNFVKGYVDTAIEIEYGIDVTDEVIFYNDVHEEYINGIRNISEVFLTSALEVIPEDVLNNILEVKSNDMISSAGSDFYLVREGHGSGFLDRDCFFGYEEELQNLARKISMGEPVYLKGEL